MNKRTRHADLSDQLHSLNRRLRRGWITQLAPFDLSPHQFRALAALAHASEYHKEESGREDQQQDSGAEGLRVHEIADRLRIAPRSATEVIDLLEEKTLVQRGADPADRRAIRVTLTDAGIQLHARIQRERRSHAQDFFSVLSSADRAELSRILEELLEAPPRPTHAPPRR